MQVKGLSEEWVKTIDTVLTNYLYYVKWDFDKTKTLDYIIKLQKKYCVCSYRKKVYQIRKFLNHNGIKWANSIQPPSEPVNPVIHITEQQINETLDFFKNHERKKQLTALIKLGADTGARAEELYQLNPSDLDIENRVLHINHNPASGQTTKTKQSRVSFFTEETRKVLVEYFDYFNNESGLTRLFEERYIQRQFKNAPIKVKHLRKYFSQTWTRKNGNNAVKKLLMGHSTRNDVDLQHYNTQSTDELKTVYDKVMG